MRPSRLAVAAGIAVAIATAACPGPAAAQSGRRPPADSAAVALLHAAANAVGPAARRAAAGLETRAEVTGPRSRFAVEISSALDGRLRYVQLGPGDRRSEIGLDGLPWIRDAAGGATLTDSVTGATARGHDLHRIVLTLPDWMRAPALGPDTVLAGAPVRRVDGVDGFGLPVALFVGRDGMPAGLGFTNPTSNGASGIIVLLADWRLSRGLRLFHAATFVHGADRYAYRYVRLSTLDSAPPGVGAPPEVRTLVAARAADLRQLLEAHEAGRRAHLEADADLLVSGFAHDYANVARGEVSRPERAASRERFSRYLAASRFLEWDDIEPPAVRIALDGSMAHVTVRKRVRIVSAANAADTSHTVYAWTALFEKRAGEWRLVSITSTDRPGRPEEVVQR